MWARGGTASDECPTSVITPQSVAWLEAFFIRKAAGGAVLETKAMEMEAREADAMMAFEKEWRNAGNGVEESV